MGNATGCIVDSLPDTHAGLPLQAAGQETSENGAMDLEDGADPLDDAWDLIETGAWAGAREILEDIVAADRKDADAWHWLAIARERLGDNAGSKAADKRAFSLDAEEFPMPVRLDDAAWDRIVTEALAELPEQFRAALENITMQRPEFPDRAALEGLEDDADPMILG